MQNTFGIVNEMQHPSQYKFNIVIVLSIGTALLIYTIVSVCGYRTYGLHNTQDLLQIYPGMCKPLNTLAVNILSNT